MERCKDSFPTVLFNLERINEFRVHALVPGEMDRQRPMPVSRRKGGSNVTAILWHKQPVDTSSKRFSGETVRSTKAENVLDITFRIVYKF
jgi:hypothetical protein